MVQLGDIVNFARTSIGLLARSRCPDAASRRSGLLCGSRQYLAHRDADPARLGARVMHWGTHAEPATRREVVISPIASCC